MDDFKSIRKLLFLALTFSSSLAFSLLFPLQESSSCRFSALLLPSSLSLWAPKA